MKLIALHTIPNTTSHGHTNWLCFSIHCHPLQVLATHWLLFTTHCHWSFIATHFATSVPLAVLVHLLPSTATSRHSFTGCCHFAASGHSLPLQGHRLCLSIDGHPLLLICYLLPLNATGQWPLSYHQLCLFTNYPLIDCSPTEKGLGYDLCQQNLMSACLGCRSISWGSAQHHPSWRRCCSRPPRSLWLLRWPRCEK